MNLIPQYTYIIESLLATGLLYSIYMLALRNRPMLVFNRFVLLLMVVLGIVLPLINFQLPQTTEIPTSGIIVEAIEYSTADFVVYSEVPRQINYWHLIYLSVTSILLVYLLFRLIEIHKFRRKSAVCEKGAFSYFLIQGKYSHFSFFKTIFINKSLVETEEEFNSILEHEKVHVKQKHTFDILFLEFLKVFLWFNPFLWLFKKCVTENHEYLADRNMLKNTSKNIVDYFNELLHSSLRTANISLANNFNHSILKKRVVMMTKKRFKRTERIILFIIVSCIALTSVFFSCKKENLVDKNTIGEVIKLGEWPPKGYLDPKETEITSEGEKIHFYPEKMPMFKGKDFNEFRNYIKENLIYPDEAKLNGWEGKVSVRFNISSEGKVIDATRIGGTDNILSDEALRVIQSSPDWKPGSEDGKNVAVQFTFPVIFSMGEKSPKKYTPLNPNNIVNDFKQGISAEWHYRKQNEDTVIITIKARIPHGHEFFENSISGNVDVEFIINKTLKQLENLQIVSSDHPMLSEDAKERIIHCAKSGIFTAQIENKYPKAKYFQIHYAYVFDLF